MAVPTTMVDGVARLRELAAASRNDVFDGTIYWTDAQLLDVLTPFIEYGAYEIYPVDTANKVFTYNAELHHYIDTATILLSDTDLSPTYDIAKRTLTFATAVTKTVTFTAPVYNLYKAAAELWQRKANQRYDFIRVKAGANQVFLEQEYNHCVERASFYRNRIMSRHQRKGGWA